MNLLEKVMVTIKLIYFHRTSRQPEVRLFGLNIIAVDREVENPKSY